MGKISVRVGSHRFFSFLTGICTALGIVSCTLPFATACPSAVVIMRHAEKDPQNELSQEGWRRAQSLPAFFQENPTLHALGNPVAIYAAAPMHANSSIRPQQTVTPLAAAMGLRINLSFNRDEVRQMASQILQSSSYDYRMVVVCWVHRTIDEIPSAFGLDESISPWPNTTFDRVWVLRFDPSCSPHLTSIQETLP